MKRSHSLEKKTARSGTSLVELVAVISIMGTVMTVLISILFHCMRTDQRFSDTGHQMQTINSLATDFRNDIHFHSLENMQIDPQQRSLKILEDATSNVITYRWDEHRLSRESQSGKDQPENRERYWFPKGSIIKWELDKKTNMVLLQIDQPNGSKNPTVSDQASYRKLVLEAEAGRFILPVAKGAAQ